MDDATADLLEMTANQAVAALADGRTTSVALVTAALDRAEALADLRLVITLEVHVSFPSPLVHRRECIKFDTSLTLWLNRYRTR